MRITANFSQAEFNCKSGASMPQIALNNLVEFVGKTLQPLRQKINAPIIVNSGYRSPDHNRAIGGAARSMHLYDRGAAADIRSPQYTPQELFNIAKKMMDEGEIPKGGLKAYSTFLHIDNRGHFATW